MSKLVEVRCCCNPAKLLGRIPFYGERFSHVAHKPVSPTWVAPADDELAVFNSTAPVRLELEIGRWYGGNRDGGFAYKSRDYAIADLETIPGWQPADV